MSDRVEVRASSVPSYASSSRGTVVAPHGEGWTVEMDTTRVWLAITEDDLRKLSILEVIAEAAQ